MPRSRRSTGCVLLLLLAAALAGCAAPSDGDEGPTQPGPEPPEVCDRGPEYQWAGFFGEPASDQVVECWINRNGTVNETEPFYFVAVRDRGGGEWAVTARDGADETFLDLEFGPAPNYRCDDRGRNATPGNWTVRIRYRDLTGNPTLRIDAEEPEDDEWQCLDEG